MGFFSKSSGFTKTLTVPTHENGSPYLYEMVCDNGRARVYGDTPAELLAYLIRGYENMSEQERLKQRVNHAVETQLRLQAQVNIFFSDAEQTNEERIILQGPRTSPPMIREWSCEVPLILVDVFYSPYTNVPCPTPYTPGNQHQWGLKNVWWLRPQESEMAYLTSLHETSFVDVNVSKK